MDVITLKRAERRELNRWVRGQSRDAAQARRARLILLLADGERSGLIRDRLDCDTNFIGRWKSRFVAERLAGLYSRHSQYGGSFKDTSVERTLQRQVLPSYCANNAAERALSPSRIVIEQQRMIPNR
jgi:hypothetical protein